MYILRLAMYILGLAIYNAGAKMEFSPLGGECFRAGVVDFRKVSRGLLFLRRISNALGRTVKRAGKESVCAELSGRTLGLEEAFELSSFLKPAQCVHHLLHALPCIPLAQRGIFLYDVLQQVAPVGHPLQVVQTLLA